MKIAICYPPLESSKGKPLLSQNRQFQWTKGDTVIYPVIAAQAATLLKENGDEIYWLDGIAQQLTFDNWFQQLVEIKPEVMFIETKTPVVKRHWKIINIIKKRLPKTAIILAGDHVTALPEESLKESKADYVITGGNFDTGLLQLVKQLKQHETQPNHIWTSELRVDLDKLPIIDRDLTQWQRYAYKNGNFKYTPGAYIMAGRDCWWRQNGGCSFCSWTTLFPQFSLRSVNNVIQEIEQLTKLGVKEIFDDTGTLMIGEWLSELCRTMIKRGLNQKVVLGGNMRFGYLRKKDYTWLAKAGFRFLLYGLESGNQNTLDKINKGTRVEQVEQELKLIQEVNRVTGGHLEPHITCMVGYPWETKADAQKTVDFCKRLFEKGLISSLQATIVIPYPGTKLFKEAEQNNWLITRNWDRFDMKESVLKSPLTGEEIHGLTKDIYLAVLTPHFFWTTITSIKSVKDVKIILKKLKAYLFRLADFGKVDFENR